MDPGGLQAPGGSASPWVEVGALPITFPPPLSSPLPLLPSGAGFCPAATEAAPTPTPQTFQLRVWPLELGGLGLNSSSATSPLASDFISLWLSFPFCKMGAMASATLTVWSQESAS